MEPHPERKLSRMEKIALWSVVVTAATGLLAALPTFIGLYYPSNDPNPAPTVSMTPPLVPDTPTSSPLTPLPPRTSRPVPPPITVQPPPVVAPSALVGHWSGGGNPSFDQYYQSLEIVFTPDGEYEELRGGISRSRGLYEADNTRIVFQSSGSAPEITPYRITRFAGRPTLELIQRSGAIFKLQKIN